MLGAVIGVQQVEAHLLQPFLMGRAVAVHPLAVILAIGTGAIVAGLVGALYAVPFVAVANVVTRYIARGSPPVEEYAARSKEASETVEQPLADEPDPVTDSSGEVVAVGPEDSGGETG